ncbi:MAG: alanine/glycine:cation symporter family protein [Sphingomonadales bacterium]
MTLFLLLTAVVAVAVALPASAQGTLDETMAGILGPIGTFLSDIVFYEMVFQLDPASCEPGTPEGECTLGVPLIVVWMGLPMLILTGYFGFINFKGFKIAWKILRGRYWDETAPGEVSQFQALTTALSGTVGIGNIAGVGVAIALGGPGATFWMIIIGFCAMSVKFAECTLGVKYRETHADGTVSGGPMYYLKNGLANRGYVRLGLILSGIYALFGLPTILQWATVNQMHSMVNEATGWFPQGWTFGLMLAVLVGAIIIGGIKTIVRVTSKLVPLMVFIYLSAALVIIGMNITEVPAAFATIFELAFNPEAAGGAIIGVIIIGMRRAVYSTEAGLGTSSMVHAAAKTREPVSEGMVGLMEPFIDTVVVSTITALVIVISGAWQQPGLEDIKLTSKAFETSFVWFPYVLALAVFLFGFSTIISWGYYTEKIWTFIFGDSMRSVVTFKTLFCLLLIPGAVLTASQVFDIIDSLFFLLAIPNIVGLYIMAPEIKADLKSYLARLKSGEIKETVPVPSPAE